MSHPDDLPPEILDAARALEQHRPQLTEPQLARIKRRVTGPAPTPRTRPTGGFMRSRLAITAMLATGVLMSGSGAALGVSALSTDLTASSAQYGTGSPNPGPGSQNSGTNSNNAGQNARGSSSGAGNVLGARASGPTAGGGDVAGVREGTTAAARDTAVAQAPRQLSASEADRLPFTGYAAIPLLLIGLALLASGLVLRRSTRGAPIAS